MSSSQIQFGLPLVAPSKQTILPIIDQYGQLQGFFPIASTTFAGTETTFALSQGAVPITTVTLQDQVQTNHGAARVQQYMAAKFPAEPGTLHSGPATPQQMIQPKPWLGYSELVPIDTNNRLGFYSWWSMPVTTWIQHFNTGAYIGSLIQGMANFTFTPVTPTPPAPVTPQVLEWACSLDMVAFADECSFFDFRWDTLFKTAVQADPNSEGSTVIPLTITVTSNPPGGFFKASILQAEGSQTIVPGGGVMFNTIRILRLEDPTPATYTFNFSISANVNGIVVATPAVLNLTVV